MYSLSSKSGSELFNFVLFLGDLRWNDISVKIQGQSKDSKVKPINNALISNLMTDLESLYNFLSEYMF